MTESNKPHVGSIVWQDLTVENAAEIYDFYSNVVGWQSTPQEAGADQDFNIIVPDTGETVAGICYARGANANIPPQWLVYITVEDVDQSAQRCIDLGGKVLDGPRLMGDNRFCVIQDPAGAVAALISS